MTLNRYNMLTEIKSKIAAIWIVWAFVPFLSACSDDDKDTPSDAYVKISAEQLEYDAEGGTRELDISSNTDYTVSFDADWFSIKGQAKTANYSGDQQLTISAAGNTTTEARTGTFLINAGDQLNQTIEIKQLATHEEEGETDKLADHIEPDHSEMSDLNSIDFAKQMTLGWNVGNSLDAIGGETAWGNPVITQELINAVKEAGFNAIRLPVAWSRFSDESNYTIDETWMARVEQVVNYALNNDMYVILNIHWDGGWMQPLYSEQDAVNERLAMMWTQIAKHFRDYNDHLLFAGTNEVMVKGEYGTPTEENYTVQNSFNQTFVNTVRATGGRNTYRYLVAQGYNTNINHTVNFAEIPEDSTENRLMMEVHYYDPYDFVLNEGSDNIWQWGENATDEAHTDTWGDQAYADGQFEKMKTEFIDKGIAVILGEYGAISRLNVEGHEAYRAYYDAYITSSAASHGLVPFYWDNGASGDHGFALFDRHTGEVLYPDIVEGMVTAAGN